MTFKKSEKEIIKTMVKYGEKNDKSLAEVLNESKLLEKRGIAIVYQSGMLYVFTDKHHYDYEDSNKAFSYIAELMSLVTMLIDNRYIVINHIANSYTNTIGVNGFRGINPEWYQTDRGERICLADRNVNWFDTNGHQKCWPFHFSNNEMPLAHFFNSPFSVAQELRDLVKNHFKTEEQVRFDKQQRLTWISIAVTGFIGLAGLIIALISLCN